MTRAQFKESPLKAAVAGISMRKDYGVMWLLLGRKVEAIVPDKARGGFQCGGFQKTHDQRRGVSDMQPLGCYTAPSNDLSWPSADRVCRLPRAGRRQHEDEVGHAHG
jgi:hypothetical protein